MVPEKILAFIREGSKFIVAGHKEPDGDCIGGQLALVSALRRMGKEAIPCSAGHFKRPEIKSRERLFTSAPTEQDRAGARVIIIDCSSADRTGDLEPFLTGLPTAIIDHHDNAVSPELLDSGLCFLNPKAPSATFMVFRVIKALGLELLREEAELLFFGLCTDTGFFRHLGEGSAEAFETAADLVRAGANPKIAFATMHGGKSFDSRKLMGFLLLRAESFFGGKLILSCEEYEDTCRFGLEGRDSDSLYQLFQSIAGVEAIVIIRQEAPDNCTVGFRSRDSVDVGRIAASFGGGGHKNAAGLSIAGTIEELKPRIVQSFEGIL
ncbi:MAG: bifunctional oligoribonuclease/PAP phosphatase NrnA [Treponema sp.]|nr:bifunctional oligoribonuclease/PAP phosphatase NrnA [Treponema sp.]